MSVIVTTEKPLEVKEVSRIPTCCLCCEQATIYVKDFVYPYLCNIPGNHKEYDGIEGVPLVEISAE